VSQELSARELELRRALAAQPANVSVLIDLALSRMAAADYLTGRTLLGRAQLIDPSPPEIYYRIGVCELAIGDRLAAAEAFRAAIARRPQFPEAHNNLGVALDQQGALYEAAECFRRALEARANYASAHRNLGDVLMRLGQGTEALSAFQSAAQLRPQSAEVHADLGRAALLCGEFARAAAAFERALSLDATVAEWAANLGEARRQLGACDAASSAFQHAVDLNPRLAEAHLGLARSAATQGHWQQAVREFLAAAGLRNGNSSWVPLASSEFESIGYRLYRSGEIAAARQCFEGVLELEPARAGSVLGMGLVHEAQGSIDEALPAMRAAVNLATDAQRAEALGCLVSCALRVCQWDLAREGLAELARLPHGLDALPPFLVLSTPVEPVEQAALARRAAARLPQTREAIPCRGITDPPIRVAYVSPDLREHAVASALVGVIEHHDRRSVTPIAVSLSASRHSTFDARLRSAFAEFVDAATLSDGEIIERMRELRIDIAVDLAGHTKGGRPTIFARGVAPVQINYLGYAGSMGGSFMHYIVADPFVIPAGDEPLFSETVLRLPHCYLPYDNSRSIADTGPTRAECGLPESGFVFCAFGAAYKLTGDLFGVWMNVLREVPGSVLWLRSANTRTLANLRAAAVAAGVAPERLVFAPFIEPMGAHQARCRHADLFLDTFPYNAHSSALEVLGAGVPVLTCRGGTFAGRVGASLLENCGLRELICADMVTYRERAVALARSPESLRGLRARLQSNVHTSPLFDTARYTRDWETVLLSAWRRRSSGSA
jgi:predicted O-linked N-acetylglucosamine transferase (SPINDLY family)